MSRAITFPAWANGEYISAERILRNLREHLEGLKFSFRIDEAQVGIDPNWVDSINGCRNLTVDEAINSLHPDIQVVDGEISSNEDGEFIFRMVAVDSTSWDIVTNLHEIYDLTTKLYPDSLDVTEQYFL